MACSAVLAMADGNTKAEPVHTHVTRLLTIEPLIPSAIQRLPTASVTWKLPSMTVDVTARNPRGERSLVGEMKFAAALLTTPVSGPCAQIASIMASTASASRMSQTCVATLPEPAAAISFAASSRTAGRRPQMCTAAPFRANAFDISRPSPLPPPVTSTDLPASASATNTSVFMAAGLHLWNAPGIAPRSGRSRY